MPAEATLAKAIDTLDTMAHIVDMERLAKGSYVDPNVCSSNAICGGHNYCAIGALWIGGGISVEYDKEYETFELPGVEEEDRGMFLRPRHGLRLAYEALNAAAARYIERHSIDVRPPSDWMTKFESEIEQLFEYGATSDSEPIGRPELLAVIADAKRALMAEVDGDLIIDTPREVVAA